MMRTSKFFCCFMVSLLVLSAPLEAYDATYLNEVVGRKAVSLGDGIELIMIVLHLEEKHTTFDAQIGFMKAHDLIKPSLTEETSDALLQRGALAYMLCKTLKLKGGLKARLLGLSERFAMEELIYQGIMRQGHSKDLVTGQELVLIMTGAAQHMLSRTR